MQNKKFSSKQNGKGYYIALILCAVAIGLSGILYYRNVDPGKKNDTPAIATDGNGGLLGSNPTNATDPTSPSTDPTNPQKKPWVTGAPLSGRTVGEYAMDCLVYNPTTRDWRTHDGVDIAAEAGTKVCAAAEGTVSSVYEDPVMGMTVVISHDDGYKTVYSSLSEQVSVAVGDQVKVGQTIGEVGLTALLECALDEHVHFSVTKDDKVIDPQDFYALSE